jgi:hypothetical protein
MSIERGLEATRAIREAISREHGNDTRRLISHYLEYQKRFASQLRQGPGRVEPGDDSPETSKSAPSTR